MSVQFKAVSKKNPSKLNDPRKYYAQAVSRGNTTFRQIAKEIANISTVSPIDTMAVLEAFIQIIPEELLKGNTVRLGDFGSFSVSIKSEPSDTPQDLKSTMIKKQKILFRPGRIINEKLEVVEFEKIG